MELGGQKVSPNITLKINNVSFSDTVNIVINFGKYFSTSAGNTLLEYFGANRSNSCTASKLQTSIFSCLLVDEVAELLINSLRNTDSTSPDNMSVRILKSRASIVSEPLAFLINLSISFKKSDPDNITNYRPISIPSVFSKIFDKIVSTRLTDFLNKIIYCAINNMVLDKAGLLCQQLLT